MLNSQKRRLASVHLLAFCGFVMGLAVTLPAWAEPTALCRAAYLKNFHVVGTKDRYEGKDLCAEDGPSLPPKFQDAIRDAKDVHEKVAAVFGMAPAELYPEGVNLKIVAGEDGLNGTYKDDLRQVELGAVPSPRNWINVPVYAHEMGHWVADSKNPAVSSAFRESRSTFLLDETYADTVALAAFGATSEVEADLPACMSVRTIDGRQTYTAPMDFFADRAGARNIYNCCEANRGRLSPNAENLCASVRSARAKRPPPPLRPNLKFSAALALKDLSRVDTHQIGVPVNSFLFALGKAFGRPVFGEFLSSLKGARSDAFVCQFRGDGKRAESFPIRVTPFIDHLEAFHGSLAPGEQKQFAPMVKSFGLQEAFQIDEADLMERVDKLGLDAAYAALKENRSPRLNQKHRCFQPLSKFMVTEGAEFPRGCDVDCRPVKITR